MSSKVTSERFFPARKSLFSHVTSRDIKVCIPRGSGSDCKEQLRFGLSGRGLESESFFIIRTCRHWCYKSLFHSRWHISWDVNMMQHIYYVNHLEYNVNGITSNVRMTHPNISSITNKTSLNIDQIFMRASRSISWDRTALIPLKTGNAKYKTSSHIRITSHVRL